MCGNKEKTVNVLVYGGGAVGLGISSCLLKSNISTDIIARKQTRTELVSKGLIREGIFGEIEINPKAFHVYTQLSDIPVHKKYTHICVCTKSYDTPSAAQDIYNQRHILEPGSIIVLFQNGWGNDREFYHYFPEEKIFSARIITGFIRTQPNVVTITVHADDVHIGNPAYPDEINTVEPLCEAITHGDLPCIPVKEIGKDIWAKMLYNCSLNPLGAVLGVPYGKLSLHSYTRNIMNMVIQECFSVMIKEGHTTHWSGPKDYIDLFYSTLIPRTAEHESSMLQDLRVGKKTEIDALNGQIVKLGKKHKISVKVNETLVNLVKALETGLTHR